MKMKEKLLLLHGALGSKKQFASVKPLLENTFDIYDMDFAGHGDFKSNNNFSMQLFTQNVIDYLNQKNIENINIFGYSMGGYVALNMALKNRDKIKKIATLGTKFNWSIESAQKETRMLNPDKIEEKVPHFANKLKEEHFPQDWKKIIRKTAGMMMGLAEGEKLTDADFKQINTPVQIGVGSLDKMVTIEESENAADLIPNATFKIIEGIPHPIDKIDTNALFNYIHQAFKPVS